MFKFLQQRREKREAEEAKAALFKRILAELQAGRGNPLEAALVLQSVEPNQESLTRLLITFGSAEVHTLNKGQERLQDAAMTEGSDGKGYVATFTSPERATAAAGEWGSFSRVASVSPLELVFGIGPDVGIVLNPNDNHLHWSFTPEHVANLRTLFERSFNYEEGWLYAVWGQGGYRAVKVLKVDEKGMHIRLYANIWTDRPSQFDPATLTLSSLGGDSIRAAGHLPLTRSSFLAMGPKAVSSSGITDDELEGYKMWEKAKGGYFGA